VIDAVLFDWGGTLTPYHDLDLMEFWSAAAQVIAPERAEELATALLQIELAAWQAAKDTMVSFTTAQLMRTAREAIGWDVEEAVEQLAVVAYRDRWAPYMVHRRDAESVLRGIRARELRIGMLSNTHWPREWHEDALAAADLLELIDARVYTSELPHLKPHPAAFAAVLDAVGATAKSSVFVGDRRYDDISGAEAVGMRTVWVRNDVVPGYDVEPDAVIDELSELIDVLDGWA
jgi:putative hydrolase of the HAD superfamily